MITFGALLLILAGCDSTYSSATRALQEKDVKQAQGVLRGAPDECLHSSTFYGLLGVVSELSGQTEQAEKAFLEGLKVEPQSIRLREQLAATYLKNHKAALAAAELKQVLAQDSANVKARNYLIAAYVESEDWREASRLFEEIRTREFDPAQPVLTLWFAQTLIHTKETERLQHDLPAATTAMPSAFLFSLGTLLAQNKLYGKALEYFTAIPEKDADDAVYFNTGLAYSHLQQFEEARQSYFRTIDRQAHHVDAYFRVGVDYAASGDARRAIPWIFQAHEWTPERTDITYALAEQLIQLRFFDTAEELLRHRVAPLLLVAQGDLQLAKGGMREAADLYKKALLEEKTLVPARIGLARADAVEGKIDEAVAEIKQALAMDGEDVAAMREAGILAAKQQQWSEAEQYLKNALARDKSDATVALELARVTRSAGKPAEALAVLDRVSEPVRNSSAFHLERAQVYVALKRPDEARKEREAAMALQSGARQALHFESPKSYVH